MTREAAPRAVDGANGIDPLDVVTGVWEEARFARLPWDAPAELKELVEDIDNPKRVYSVHRASRRHNFQQLVQKYIVQLRDGCGADHCSTPTCFTCRKRAAGRAPMRRFNTTSAMTLATNLASQDNAESGLCPFLRPPKAPPAALNSLVFGPSPKVSLRDGRVALGSPPKSRPAIGGSRPGRSRNGSANGGLKERPVDHLKEDDGQLLTQGPGFSITEEPVSKDYRSFAANVFGTVAFKMLEWLTPASIEDMSRRAENFQTSPREYGRSVAPNEKENLRSRSTSPRPRSAQALPTKSNGDPAKPRETVEPGNSWKRDRANKDEKVLKEEQQSSSTSASRPGTQRCNSNAKVRTAAGPKPKRQLSIDPFASEIVSDDTYPSLLKSPRANGGNIDRTPRGLKTANPPLTRPISQLSSAGFFDDVTLEKMPPPRPAEIKHKVGRSQMDGARSSESGSPKEPLLSSRSCSNNSATAGHSDSDQEDDSILPQALSRLNADVVDFICDVIQEDGTADQHMLEPPTITRFHNRYGSQGRPLKRKSRSGRPYPAGVRREWKLFVEQTLFYILSDPRLAVRSFTKKGQLYDSQTLWYCMLRMTRIAPSLVFHSLWMAAASLFPPPKSLQSLRSPTAKLFPKHEKSLSNADAGRLMSICLHALVAAAPLVTTDRQLFDMSRIRAHGLSLAGSGSVAQQPVSLCLQYEECFTDALAMRLARRLFAAIVTRRYYDELNESNMIINEGTTEDPDVLAPLFSQLDFLNMDAVYILNFSFPDRALHETRVPILLLDWARAVMLNDWDNSPEVPADGPFGGALALIDTMYKKRHELLLGDAQFRAEYFAERLDSVQMPVAWLSHSSTRQKLHLLDFPYLFNSSTLVSYFRSINFSRMSYAFEEATSVQDEIDAIATRLSLDQHHKEVLADRLKVPAAKYLSLDIRRENVLQDAFNQLWRREERELLRPLKVHLGVLTGEEGFDSGGVQQEFFRMAIAEALHPDYGAFTVDERTRMTWFVPGSMEPEWKFQLIGMLVSLAVYNGLTLPVTFPKALYRKLLGEPVTELLHISDGWPDLASGLNSLLEWDEKDGLVEDVFARTYEFSVSVFGHVVTREMKAPVSISSLPPSSFGQFSLRQAAEKGKWPQFKPTSSSQATWNPSGQNDSICDDEAPLVTNANRNAYVSDYIRYLTDVSVRPQYEAFARGFRACLHPKSLSLLTSSILQSIVEGVQEIDVLELKRYTRYVGWDASHRTVRDFWSIVRRYDEDMKRKLLEFVTASDRVPVGGIKNMMFIIQKNGSEDEPGGRLPTSYTCYGTLLLPEYKDKEMLRERLAMALENAQGFGFA
ncbi:hypothetical protein B0H66DRAFT_278525 [Apodospora peruviana]|uniref:HECT-type E3 ubiquitin transferase n=1 Tax=Apodospora peruviana TaxID=516989 RepID=A0AAE0M1X9_9PEZI|nr:hypothetical protein B0H66DRAFT_278525 [Apodospora peruviana]